MVITGNEPDEHDRLYAVIEQTMQSLHRALAIAPDPYFKALPVRFYDPDLFPKQAQQDGHRHVVRQVGYHGGRGQRQVVDGQGLAA